SVFSLARDKGTTRFCLGGGLTPFATGWKIPTAAERHFGLDTYVAALEQAVDTMRTITASEDVNIWGSCSGGITTSAFLAHLAARGEGKVHIPPVALCLLDMAGTHNTGGAPAVARE